MRQVERRKKRLDKLDNEAINKRVSEIMRKETRYREKLADLELLLKEKGMETKISNQLPSAPQDLKEILASRTVCG